MIKTESQYLQNFTLRAKYCKLPQGNNLFEGRSRK